MVQRYNDEDKTINDINLILETWMLLKYKDTEVDKKSNMLFVNSYYGGRSRSLMDHILILLQQYSRT